MDVLRRSSTPDAGRFDGSRIRCLRASVRHFLVWLGQEDIDIGVIDDAVSGRRRRAPRALASVRRSNGTCGFPAYRFHEDVFA